PRRRRFPRAERPGPASASRRISRSDAEPRRTRRPVPGRASSATMAPMLRRLPLLALLALTASCADVGPDPDPDPDPDPRLPELGPLPDELADLRWPAPPGITTEVDVHTLAELLDATSRPGTRVRV